jgi:hypothetical protein
MVIAVLLSGVSGCVGLGRPKPTYREVIQRNEQYVLIIEGLERDLQRLRMENKMLRMKLEALSPGATRPAEPAGKDRKILAVKSHRLDWKNYDGTGDPLKAEYYLDGIKLGTGEKGVAELKRLIAKMTKGSDIDVVPYYEGKRPYPFEKKELQEYCDKHGVSLGIPVVK